MKQVRSNKKFQLNFMKTVQMWHIECYFVGIVKLWYNHVEYTLITYQRYHHDAYKSNEAQAFTMVDMQTAFYILCIGLGCSCIVFMYELYTHKREQSQPFEFVH